MGHARYFDRAAVAASHALHGYNSEALRAKLSDVTVGLAWDAAASEGLEGRLILEMTVRLLARLYPVLALQGPDEECSRLDGLARSINSQIAVTSHAPDVAVVVGGSKTPAVVTVYATSQGWNALVSTRAVANPASTNNPFGAAAAACLAVANVFRAVMLPHGEETLDDSLVFSLRDRSTTRDKAAGNLETQTLSRRDVLVGVGAVGSAAAWCLARAPLEGEFTVVDPERVDLGNLQRYVIAQESDEGSPKVALATRELSQLRVVSYETNWAGLVAAEGWSWNRVVAAVDTANARREIQSSLPRWVANAWTQPGDLGLSEHRRFGNGACLRCLYLPARPVPSEDEMVASALGLDINVHGVMIRRLLYTGEQPAEDFLLAVAEALHVDFERVAPFAEGTVRDLYVQGVCGGAVLPVEEVGVPVPDVHVPVAHQSALAGVMLAAALVRGDAPANGGTDVTRVDVLRRFGQFPTVPAQAERRGLCICQDPIWRRAYINKHKM